MNNSGGVVNNGGGYACVEVEGIWEISVSSEISLRMKQCYKIKDYI
jgi:hypothetical protein